MEIRDSAGLGRLPLGSVGDEPSTADLLHDIDLMRLVGELLDVTALPAAVAQHLARLIKRLGDLCLGESTVDRNLSHERRTPRALSESVLASAQPIDGGDDHGKPGAGTAPLLVFGPRNR